MDFSELKVLVMDAAGKQTLAMVRGLKEPGCSVSLRFPEMSSPDCFRTKPSRFSRKNTQEIAV